MIDLLRLCRLYYALPMAFAYGLTVVYARGGSMEGEWMGTLLSAMALALVIAAGYVFNDVRDAAIDRINAPQRPVAAGRISARVASVWAAVLLAVGLVLGAFAAPAFLAVLAIVAAGLALYDLKSKRLGIGKPLLVAVLLASIYPLALAQAGGATGPRAWTLAVFPAWLFLTSFGYEVLKDIRDIPGDRMITGWETRVQRSPRRWRLIANVAIVSGAVLLVGPLLLGCGRVYAMIALLAVAVGVLAVRMSPRTAIACLYAECCLVGLAATADLWVPSGPSVQQDRLPVHSRLPAKPAG
jgi:4-hydroxybenzoate polyprenyltransferase